MKDHDANCKKCALESQIVDAICESDVSLEEAIEVLIGTVKSIIEDGLEMDLVDYVNSKCAGLGSSAQH
jgi:hypothetical protein